MPSFSLARVISVSDDLNSVVSSSIRASFCLALAVRLALEPLA